MTDGLYGCNPERSHSGPCGAEDCWWQQLVDALDLADRPQGVPARKNAEQSEILGTFSTLLEVPTGDGATKRAAGVKPFWKVDPGHRSASARHGAKYEAGERYDRESGAHHLVHRAWRDLATAFQDMVDDGLIPESPAH